MINQVYKLNTKHPLARGLKLWWLCTPDTYGSVKMTDLCSNIPGTLTNMTSANRGWANKPNPAGQWAIYTDGTSGNRVEGVGIDCMASPSTAWSMSFWHSRNGAAQLACFVARTSTGRSGAESSATSNGLNLFVNATTNYYLSTIGLEDVWNHHVITYNDGAFAHFMNGKSQSLTLTGTIPTAVTGTKAATQMGSSTDASKSGVGWYNDARIWNRALSATECVAVYRESYAGNPNLLLKRQFAANYYLPMLFRTMDLNGLGRNNLLG